MPGTGNRNRVLCCSLYHRRIACLNQVFPETWEHGQGGTVGGKPVIACQREIQGETTQSAAKPSICQFTCSIRAITEACRYFGSHLEEQDSQPGAVFRVWAPHAKAVSVVGDFNSWVPTIIRWKRCQTAFGSCSFPASKSMMFINTALPPRRMSWCTRLTRIRSIPKPDRQRQPAKF